MPDNTDRGIWERLTDYGRSDAYPMHMPGHKRRGAPVCQSFPWQCDITEIDGFDDLHDARGILREAQQRAARLYGSGRAWFLVNGSTCGVLAAIGACTRPGDTVLLARNCHKSAYHALELWGLRPVYLSPESQSGFPFCGCVRPGAVRDALSRHPRAKAVVVTSPTYEGIVSDITAIAAACHEREVPLIVDEAHGAHFGFHPGFPQSAARCGADLVVQSLHKTLPAPTQTALLHHCGALVDPGRVAHQLDILETSSPSYLLMSMIDRCLRFLEREGAAYFESYSQRLRRFAARCALLTHLTLFTGEALRAQKDFCPDFDPGKLIIGCGHAAIDGPALAGILRERYRIETEMAQADYLLAMTSLMDEEEGFERLASALLAIDRTVAAAKKPPCAAPCPQPPSVLPIRDALEAEWEAVPWEAAAGRVSAGYIWAYPPGIPWLTPGEIIEPGCIRAALRAGEAGISLKTTRQTAPGAVAVLIQSHGIT